MKEASCIPKDFSTNSGCRQGTVTGWGAWEQFRYSSIILSAWGQPEMDKGVGYSRDSWYDVFVSSSDTILCNNLVWSAYILCSLWAPPSHSPQKIKSKAHKNVFFHNLNFSTFSLYLSFFKSHISVTTLCSVTIVSPVYWHSPVRDSINLPFWIHQIPQKNSSVYTFFSFLQFCWNVICCIEPSQCALFITR